MATARFGIAKPGEGQSNDVPVDLGAVADGFDAITMGYLASTLSLRPSPGVRGRIHYQTDWTPARATSPLTFDTGSAWIDVAATKQLALPFFVSGPFTTGLRPASWIAPAACTLYFGYGAVDGGSPVGSATCKWQLALNGTPQSGTLSTTQTLGSGVQYSHFGTPLVVAEGDRLQLNINSVANTVADLSVTVAGLWNAQVHT